MSERGEREGQQRCKTNGRGKEDKPESQVTGTLRVLLEGIDGDSLFPRSEPLDRQLRVGHGVEVKKSDEEGDYTEEDEEDL